MKKLLLTLLIAAIATTVSVAQEQPKQPDQERIKKEKLEWDKKIKDELRMTPEQLDQYNAISKEYGEKIEALMKDNSLEKVAQKERKMALKKEKEAKLIELFTPEQETRYRELMDKKNKEKSGT